MVNVWVSGNLESLVLTFNSYRLIEFMKFVGFMSKYVVLVVFEGFIHLDHSICS